MRQPSVSTKRCDSPQLIPGRRLLKFLCSALALMNLLRVVTEVAAAVD
jgi:hypothetical protein